MTVITMATLGSRDVGEGGEWWAIITIIGGLTLLTILGAQITAFIVENRILGIVGRKKMQKKLENLEGHIVVCGFGRTGQQIAVQLRDSGKTLLIVESDQERAISALSNDFLVIQGDAQEEDIIAQMRLPQAAVLVTCLSNDAANLFLTLSARQENPSLFIIARVMQESSMSKLNRAGANRVICPQLVGSNRIVDLVLRPEMVDFYEMAHHNGVDLEMVRYEIMDGSPLVDKTLAEIALPKYVGAHVVAIQHNTGRINYHPTYDLKLVVGDEIILVGKEGINKAMEQFKM
jgi:voltage-gated potassium channel